MSRLSDQTIADLCIGLNLIGPFRPETHLQPCSYDLSVDGYFIIEPGEFKLVSTQEYIRMPEVLSGKVEGRSSIGRLGVFVIVASGFVDAGFEGNLTLECFNASKDIHSFSEGTRIAQIVFDELDLPARRPYKGRYYGQKGVTPSRL